VLHVGLALNRLAERALRRGVGRQGLLDDGASTPAEPLGVRIDLFE
jgi:hypothetical protein